MTTSFSFVDWFRHSSPYINAHRGRTFVVLVEGEAMAAGRGESLIQDLALLHTLGVKLVVVFGIRHQVHAVLDSEGIVPVRHQARWVADDTIMARVERVAAEQRLWLEARLSLGLPNTPLHGIELTTVSGNLVMAKPLGVRDGVDFQRSGEVRRVRSGAVRALLDQQSLVLLPPLGFSSTGEVFDLDAAEVAQQVAVALKADKLILLGQSDGLCDEGGQLLRQLTPAQARPLLAEADPAEERSRHLEAACEAATHGVARTHLLSWRDADALLAELFTRDGVGTMITEHRYEQLRAAEIDDIGGLLELLEPLEKRGMLVPRSRERLEHEIDDYLVIERDGMVIGCAALHRFTDASVAELACVAVHPDYRSGARGERLLAEIERLARRQGIQRLFALTTHTAHWFLEHGFVPSALDELPPLRRDAYNHARQSKVLCKGL
ncbi:amino-acid N-acetyltransferase [Halomonas denitrificans]|uniref:amino-acid N-acetyltransferase n=1 Tax=Halomonas TaxID=2745 RepID=UPI001A8D115F|nr:MULTISPECIES: amino-acid N-acetyltransferase [Halomonas]MBN8411737.1 amino-acid N-acetyltransferase [Halomonas litopenaei]MBY5923752.1 amino-acid N-acetyltransferase [Halomonas sp. DP4Y7-2]MBY5927898.1 amino-acid N-acetyltransferase [Halomonas sp. DP8Y7-3]MBY5983055.1 amino-acid N-acetyltransferase [Halomonas sp. DP5Y7-2]MBY6028943.1 amino-acid N-acetyltransferase [Halomonas sp. DP8Y7-1]